MAKEYRVVAMAGQTPVADMLFNTMEEATAVAVGCAYGHFPPPPSETPITAYLVQSSNNLDEQSMAG